VFALLYSIVEGEFGTKIILKMVFCGADTSSAYAAGHHITLDMLTKKNNGTEFQGKTLGSWAWRLTNISRRYSL
jgi:hypothetical protein